MLRVVFLLLLLVACPAFAVGTLDPAIATDGLLVLVKTTANSWVVVLRNYATTIFWSLAIIQAVWTFGMMALRQADFSEVSSEIVRFTVTIGFFAALLLYSVEWAQAIVDSFRKVAADAASMPVELAPGDMFALAVELARNVGVITLTDPITAFVVALSSILIMMCFTFIAAFMVVTLIESYFIINAGVFFMAFAGSQWTRDYAMAMLRYSVSVGAKLFVLTLIVGLIMTSARTWQAAYTHDETSMFTMVGLALVCAYLSKTLPDMIQALISGVSPGGGSQVGGMLAAGLAGVATGMAAASSMASGGVAGGAMKGVGDLIKSSVSGFTGGGGGSAGSFMNSGGGASPGVSPRTGGGGYSQPSAPPKAASSSSAGASSAPSSAPSASSSATSQSAPSGGMASSVGAAAHKAAHMATDAAVRTADTMGVIGVPGYESRGASVGPAPTPPVLGEETPENIIRSAASASTVDDAPQDAAPSTMADLQDALNKGKS